MKTIFVDFYVLNKLIIGILFLHKRIHKSTWVIPDHTTDKQIEQICINKTFSRPLHDTCIGVNQQRLQLQTTTYWWHVSRWSLRGKSETNPQRCKHNTRLIRNTQTGTWYNCSKIPNTTRRKMNTTQLILLWVSWRRPFSRVVRKYLVSYNTITKSGPQKKKKNTWQNKEQGKEKRQWSILAEQELKRHRKVLVNIHT